MAKSKKTPTHGYPLPIFAPNNLQRWGPGPWNHEVDQVAWHDEDVMLLALRHQGYGHWCGYVGIPKTHPDFGKGYDDVDVRVHGGLTYAQGGKNPTGIISDLWWFGFDCGHAGDISPGLKQLTVGGPTVFRETYKDLTYVRQEIVSLAAQLKARQILPPKPITPFERELAKLKAEFPAKGRAVEVSS